MTATSPTVVKALNTLYIDTLKDTERIKEDVPEKKNLYLSAFFGLMRNGHKYEIVKEKPKEKPVEEVEPKKKKKSKKIDEFFDDDPTRKVEVTHTLVMLIDGKAFRCPEVDLKFAFGSMYDAITGEPEKKQKNLYLNQNDNVYLPDVYADMDEKKEDASAEANKAAMPVTPAKQRPKTPTLPYLGVNDKFENDGENAKTYDSFLFNTHSSTVRLRDGQVQTYQFVVYPLLPDMDDCMTTDVLVISQDEKGRTRTAMSDPRKGFQKSVSIEYDNVSFIIRAHWEDGMFVSSVAVLSATEGDQPIFKDKITPTIPTHQTSSFYLKHYAPNGNVLNVFPLTLLRNDPKTGMAPVIFMVEDGQTRRLFSSGDNTYVSLYFAGKEINTYAYWSGNLLQVSVDINND